MANDPTTAGQELSEHLALLQRYLSDEVAPLVFAEALSDLVTHPPALVAAEIRSWTAAQYRGTSPLPISDYLFHAVRKLHVVGELELLPVEQLRVYLVGLEQILLGQCPEDDRDSLADDFAHLEESQTVLAAPVQIVHRAGVAEPTKAQRSRGEQPTRHPSAAAGTQLPARVVQGLRRLDLLLDRLEKDAGTARAGGAGISAEQEALLARFLAAAAVGASDAGELEGSLDRVRRLGIDTGTRHVLRLLGQSLPDWTPPATAETAEAPQHAAVAAMRQVVALGKDPAETARRFAELVHAACDEFNSGSLGRAVTMLDLAGRMIVEERVDPVVVRTVRGGAWSFLEAERLRVFSEATDKHQLLRGVLDFFSDLTPARLLDELSSEQRRERRRLLLSLLSVHGAPARAAAIERLQATSTAATWADWYVERNLLHVLRRVPAAADAPLDAELDVLARLSAPGAPVAVIKEAIAVLGQHRHPRAEQTLIARMSEIEDALLGVKTVPYEPGELLGLLDRTVAILARAPSSAAHRCVVDHVLKRKPPLGDTFARAVDLGSQDLAAEPELLARLVKALRDEYPTRVFGLTVTLKRRDAAISQLIAALSGTAAPVVREALAEIADRFADQPFAADATRALLRFDAAPAPAPEKTPAASLTGDLGVFGLPTLLQNLADSRVTGMLSLTRGDGGAAATIRFAGGLLTEARAGSLTGPTALFSLLERHQVDRFAFVNAQGAPAEAGQQTLDVLPLLMEGMRRLDEFQQAAVLVPDEARLKPTEVKPSRKPDETDVELMRSVWLKVVAGATPAAIEAEAGVDPYRVRRLFEHWVEEGSLALA